MMIAYLGRRLARTPYEAIAVRYLSKAEGEVVWKSGILLSIDPQGACFATRDGRAEIAECLPWGSIGAIRVLTRNADDPAHDDAPRESAAPHAAPPVSSEVRATRIPGPQ